MEFIFRAQWNIFEQITLDKVLLVCGCGCKGLFKSNLPNKKK